MTIGQKSCFSKSVEIEPLMIETTRKRMAEIIDALEKEKGDKNTAPASEEKQRLLSIAQDKLEEACMFAVKALYTK